MPNEWQAVRELPPLGDGEVQIWRADVTGMAGDPDIYIHHLSPDEVERAARYKAGQVRVQFVAARACLRVLLGRLMHLRPSEVPIAPTAYGKPELPPECGERLFFNVAHSRETVLIALCREGRVGVDLEYLDRRTDALDIAGNYFTTEEFRQIEGAGGAAERQRAFFRCWTRKEAVVKADGRGLSIPLSSIAVPVLESAAATPVVIAGDGAGSEQATWFVTDLAMGDGIAGAFAAGRRGLSPRSFAFPLEVLAGR